MGDVDLWVGVSDVGQGWMDGWMDGCGYMLDDG